MQLRLYLTSFTSSLYFSNSVRSPSASPPAVAAIAALAAAISTPSLSSASSSTKVCTLCGAQDAASQLVVSAPCCGDAVDSQ